MVSRLRSCSSSNGKTRGLCLAVLWLITSLSPAGAQQPAPGPFTAPPLRIAQANPNVPSPGIIPTDATPVSIGEEQGLLTPGLKFRLFQKLPERLWFNATTEVSQRLDTNVFFTSRNNQADYAFRVLPNITLGYNLFKRFSIYTNYFVIKDLFADHAATLNFPTTQSLSLGFRQDVPLSRRTNLQVDFQARELWQTSHLRQADLLPSINLTHVFTPNVIGFGSLVLQLRGRNYFVAPTREIDPFYTLGFLVRRGQWTFTAVDTLVTNFRSPPFHGSIPSQGNVSMIADFEVSRPVSSKVPNLQAFMRIEPIWNWSSRRVPGLSGFDYRMFGGLRLSLNKPSYNASIDQLRQQLIESEGLDPKNPAKPKSKSPSSSRLPSGAQPAANAPGAAGSGLAVSPSPGDG